MSLSTNDAQQKMALGKNKWLSAKINGSQQTWLWAKMALCKTRLSPKMVLGKMALSKNGSHPKEGLSAKITLSKNGAKQKWGSK